MANYYGKTRTNYFAVKDEDKFKELTDKLTSEGEIYVEKNSEGKWSIGSNGVLEYCVGINEEEDETEYNMQEFFDGIQECIADDDAMIFMEIGSEKLRYFIAYCIVVTSTNIRQVDLRTEALNLAAEMLNIDSFETKLDY